MCIYTICICVHVYIYMCIYIYIYIKGEPGVQARHALRPRVEAGGPAGSLAIRHDITYYNIT